METNKIKIIGFDADDTLWENESYYQEIEKQFCKILSEYLSHEEVSKELLKTEMNNLSIYGYGAKSFTLSMIETAIRVSNGNIPAAKIENITDLGKSIMRQPVTLLEDVSEILNELKSKYTLIVATKGDLTDQRRKLNNSGLIEYFDHIEIMSDKQESDYINLLNKLNIKNNEFLMIGNSLKSDILPVLSIGAKAIHIPYHTTWSHEIVDKNSIIHEYLEIERLTDLKEILL